MLVSILVFGCVGLLALSFSRRRVLLLCFFYFTFGLLTIVNNDTLPLLGGFKLYRLAYPFLLLSIMVRFFQDPTLYTRFRSWPNLGYLALLLILTVSSFYSPYVNALTVADPSGLVGILVVVSLFWMAASHVQEREDFTTFALAVSALSVTLSLWVIWTVSRGDFTAARGGTNVNENYEALFVLAGAIPLLQFIVVCKGAFKKVASSVALLLILFGSAVLASRGTLIAAFVGAVATGFGLLRRLPRRAVLAGGMLFALAIGSLMLLPGASNTVTAFQAVEVTTLDDRTVIWGYAWKHFAAFDGLKTFFGEGLSSGISVLASAFPEYGNYHNDYLMWLMDHGVVGLLVYLAFLFRIGYIIARTTHPDRHLIRGWFVFLLVAGSSSTVSNVHLYWIFLGVMVGAVSGWQLMVEHEREFAATRSVTPPITGFSITSREALDET